MREVALPAAPSALAFAPDGRLLALGPTPPHLHCVTSGASDASLLAVAPSALAAALACAIKEHALKVRPHFLKELRSPRDIHPSRSAQQPHREL